MADVVFEVEQAGCESCARRVRAALEPLAEVGEVAVDEQADRATVHASGALTEASVDEALETASDGSGHTYRIRVGSWRETA